jgi:hypothetical protein
MRLSLSRYARKLAGESGKLLIKSHSHAERLRLERLFGSLEWFGPASLGSKTLLWFVADTAENRGKLLMQGRRQRRHDNVDTSHGL